MLFTKLNKLLLKDKLSYLPMKIGQIRQACVFLKYQCLKFGEVDFKTFENAQNLIITMIIRRILRIILFFFF